MSTVAAVKTSPAVSVPQNRPWVRWLPLLALVVGVGFVLRWPVASIPLERDEGEYAYIAQHWLHGEVPYRSAFDQKPPAVFVVYAVIETFLGTSPAAIHWGMQLYTSATLVLLFFLGWRLFGPGVGMLAALAAAFLTSIPGAYGNAANTEIFMLLPITAAFLAALQAGSSDGLTWVAVTGLCSAAGMLFKQVAIFDALFCLLLIWALCKRPRAAVWTMIGVMAAVGVIVFSYFVAVGAGWDFYDCTLGYNLEHVSEHPLASYPRLFRDAAVPILWETWPFFVLALAGLILSFTRWCKGVPASSRRGCWWVTGWLVCAFAGVVPGGYFHAHYFLHLMPPLALLAGFGAVVLAELLWRRRAGLVSAALVIGALCYGVYVARWYFGPGSDAWKSRRLYGANPFPESPSVAQFIAERCGRGDTLFILGSEPQIAYYAGRTSASRYIITYPLWKNFPDTRDRQRSVLEEIAKNHPAFILSINVPQSQRISPDCPMILPNGVATLLAHEYELVAGIPLTDETPMPLVSDEAVLRHAGGRVLMKIFQRRAGNGVR